MRIIIGAAALAIIGVAATPAAAAPLYHVQLTGVLTNAGPGDPVDTHLAVGQTVTLTGRFDGHEASTWGGYGYNVTGLSLSIHAGGLTWVTSDNIYDGQDAFFYRERPYLTPDGWQYDYVQTATPALIFADGKVRGIVAFLLPSDSDERPAFDPGSARPADCGIIGSGDPCRDSIYAVDDSDPNSAFIQITKFAPFQLSDHFHISQSDLYGNAYQTQGFEGIWDFSSSRVWVPEPATWALMVSAFGLMGVTLRQRRRLQAAGPERRR